MLHVSATILLERCPLTLASMGHSLRRPLMMRFSNWVLACLEALEHSNHPSDLEMTAWARLQHIAEEIASSLGLDDTDRVDLIDPRTQSMLRAFEGRLEQWKQKYWDSVTSMFLLLLSRSC